MKPTPAPTEFPTGEPTPVPCFNDGKFCNGAGQCINGTCVCDDPKLLPPACDTPPPTPPNCADIFNSSTCDSCLANSKAIGVNCEYCPPLNNTKDLTHGVCSNSCPSGGLRTCQPEVKTVPPACLDNCTGPEYGICVNISTCDKLEKDNKAKYGNDTSLYLLSCGNNSNVSKANNLTGACACYQGKQGLNCLVPGAFNKVVFAALSAGIIALIVILALLGAACAGGGAAAVSSGVSAGGEGAVITSPLYQGNQGSGSNPLFNEVYEIL